MDIAEKDISAEPVVTETVAVQPIHIGQVHTARLDEYINAVWAMEPRRGMALFQMVGSMDLSAHIREAVKPTPSKAKIEVAIAPDAYDDDEIGGDGGDDSIDMDAVGNVAIIHVQGTLMKQCSSLDASTSTVMLRKQIRDAAKDPRFAGIILQIDSPGGSVSGTAEVGDEINAARQSKPVVAFCEDLCASAAYWIASQCDEVYCNHGTCEIGSIGTFIGTYDYSGMCEKEGILAKTYATGSLKGTGFPGAKITEEQDKYLQGIVDATQPYFANAVKAGREMTGEEVAAVATGGVFLASDPAAAKLHDGIKNFDQCLQRMGELVALQRGGGTQVGGSAMAESGKGTATPTLADYRAEAKRYSDAFGPQGAVWFAEGKTFEECQAAQVADLKASLAKKDAENTALAKDLTDLKARVEELRGAAAPVAAGLTPEKAAKEGVDVSNLAVKVGTNIAKRAAEIKTRDIGNGKQEIVIGGSASAHA